MRNSDSRVIFECESPTLFRSRRVDSLSKLKSMILSHVGGMEPKEVGRVGYRMLASMGNEVFRFRLFWLDGDEYVRLMFDVHGRIMVEQVMELSAEVRDIGGGGSGTSDFVSDDPPLAPRPLHCASPVQDMEVEGEDRTMTTLPIVTEVVHLRGAEDYNMDGSVEFRVGHRFRSREVVVQSVKNYSIRRSTKYRVVESDRMKYHVRCRHFTYGCPWTLQIALRQNLGYWRVF
ncbi:hypothetical protein Ahy_B09g095685 isoform A [Arachis hypogaea]|uniref:Transposase MuDR plant domain-containing protein n=1 Tax=Arachis hypogaea TaxID=3818 RepID=A0A444XG63_ARAHY|nr:hypothetical protein Ahy_B09g095685 isoform A [Arachis hypogaea]